MELYDNGLVRAHRYLGKSVRKDFVGTKRALVNCLCSMLYAMCSGVEVFVPQILSRGPESQEALIHDYQATITGTPAAMFVIYNISNKPC